MKYCLFANDDKSVQTPVFIGLQGNRRRCEAAINFSGILIDTPESAAVVRIGYGSAANSASLICGQSHRWLIGRGEGELSSKVALSTVMTANNVPERRNTQYWPPAGG